MSNLGCWDKLDRDHRGARRRVLRMFTVLCPLLVLLVAGCASTERGGNGPEVQSLHLFCVPIAVNLDGQPGPDGFSVRVFAKGPKSSKSVLVPKGAIELEMYDGALVEGQSSRPAPLRTWRFEGRELESHSGQSAVGPGYRFTLRWEEARPTKSRISIVVRYLPVSGPPVVSAPSSVAMGTK